MFLSSSSPLLRLPKRSLFRNTLFELPRHLMEANAHEIYTCISSLLPQQQDQTLIEQEEEKEKDQDEEEEEEEGSSEKKKKKDDDDDDVIASDLCTLRGLNRVAFAVKYWIYLRWMEKAKDDSVLEASLAAVEGHDHLTPDVKRRICRGMEAMCIFLNHPELLKRALAMKELDFSAFAHLNKMELTYWSLNGAIKMLEEEAETKGQGKLQAGRRVGCRELEQIIRCHGQRENETGKRKKRNNNDNDEDKEKKRKPKKTQKKNKDTEPDEEETVAERESDDDEEEEENEVEDEETHYPWNRCPLKFQLATDTKCNTINGHVLFCKHHKEWINRGKDQMNEEEKEGEGEQRLLQELAQAQSASQLLEAAVVLQCHLKATNRDR